MKKMRPLRTRFVVDKATADKISADLASPPKPNAALRALFKSEGEQVNEVTDEQIQAFLEEGLAAGDYRQVDICNVALSSHETLDNNGEELVGPDGHPMTRSEARAECYRWTQLAPADEMY